MQRRCELSTVRGQLCRWPASSFSGSGEGDCASPPALAAMVLKRSQRRRNVTLVTAAM
jgi:hypothetical protein